MCSFESDQHKRRAKANELRSLTNYQGPWPPSSRSDQIPDTGKSNLTTPLRPIRAKAEPFYLTPRKVESPHYAPDSAPSKYQISGYMGFVPKTQRYLGEGYPIITSKALREHDSETERMNRSYVEPVVVRRPPGKPAPSVILYPKTTGLVPRYMGHIPGKQIQ